MSALLEVKALSAGYGRVPVLHGVDLAVEEGEIVGVLGHNGMGKTTLLKTIMGIVPATGGVVGYAGRDLTRERASERARLGLGYVPQGRGIFPALSVRDNIRMGIAAHGGDEEEAVRRTLAGFPRLEPLLDREGGALSGGEQQLLAIARCLVSEPELILLDEPTEGIQPSIVDAIVDLLRDLNREQGVTIVMVEQNLDFITELSDRVLLLQKGVISGEVKGADAANPALIEEFTGFGGGGSGGAARRNPAPPAAGSRAPPSASARAARAGGAPAVPPPSAAARSPSGPPAPRPAGASSPPHPPRPSSPSSPPPPALNERISYMTVQRPTHAQLGEIVREFGMSMSDARVQEFLDVMQGTLDAYDVVDAMPDHLPPVLYPRTAGYRPSPEENPLNAWYVKTEVRGAPRGPLHGRTVALKDNVCLAGVPMMNGASTLKGYTPDVDATIVTRLLDAGATITGKAHCEYFCLSGGSHTNATGPVMNPHRAGYSAGGSSSGSGALVGGGEVDMAIGGDQGGSIRIPAAYCGCYGMKPTHGLVPYTGVMPIENTIDHTGPMTGNVRDNAAMLQAIAGADGLDPRQYDPQVDDYTGAIGRGAGGLRIGGGEGGLRARHLRGGRGRQGPRRGGALPAARRDGGRGLDSLPPQRPGHLDPDRPRRAHQPDDARQRHGHRLGGHVHHVAPRLSRQLAKPCGRALRHPQDLHVHGAVLPEAPPRALLREGAEPRAAAPGGVRPHVRRLRSPPDADPADEGDPAAAARCSARPVLPACVRDAAEHRPLRRDGAPGDVRSLRDERRASGGDDAGGREVAGGHHLPCRRRLRAGGRLARDVAVGAVEHPRHGVAPLSGVKLLSRGSISHYISHSEAGRRATR